MLRGENVQETKNPRVNHPGIPFFIPIAKLPIREERDFFLVRAGLPALGSSSGRPSHHNDSGFAAFVPDHGGGSAADFHRFPLRPIQGTTRHFSHSELLMTVSAVGGSKSRQKEIAISCAEFRVVTNCSIARFHYMLNPGLKL